MPTCHPRSWLSLLLQLGDMGILLSPPLFPPWCYRCYPFGALPPPLALFMMPPLTRTRVSWPRCRHSSPTKATKSSTTLAPILPSIVGPWACWRWQSSPSTAFPIISSCRVWTSCWSCVPVSDRCQIYGHDVHGRIPPPNSLRPVFGWGPSSWFVSGGSSGFCIGGGSGKCCSACRFSNWFICGGSLCWLICGGSSGFFVGCGSRRSRQFPPPALVLGIFLPGGFGSSLGTSHQEPLPELLSLPLFGSWGVSSSSHDGFRWLLCLRCRRRPSSGSSA
jgi:hypothetical protein